VQKTSKFDLFWPLTLNDRSDNGVTVNTFASLSMWNTFALLFLPFEIVIFFGLLKNKFDLLTPLMTFDLDTKKIHILGQNALFQFKSKHSTMFDSGEKKIIKVFWQKTGNDPLMTFDLHFKNSSHTSCNTYACTQVMFLSYVSFLR